MSGRNATRVGWTILIDAQITGPAHWEDGVVIIYPTWKEAIGALLKSYESWWEDADAEVGGVELVPPVSATEQDFRNQLGEWVVPCIEYADGSLDAGDNEDQDWFGMSWTAEDLSAISAEFGW